MFSVKKKLQLIQSTTTHLFDNQVYNCLKKTPKLLTLQVEYLVLTVWTWAKHQINSDLENNNKMVTHIWFICQSLSSKELYDANKADRKAALLSWGKQIKNTFEKVHNFLSSKLGFSIHTINKGNRHLYDKTMYK